MLKWIKSKLPAGLKTRMRLWLRYGRDLFSGTLQSFPGKKQIAQQTDFPFFIAEEQPVRSTALSENKIHNIRLAVELLNFVEIKAGQVFSFWQLVGEPSEQKGYKKGRTIVNNQLGKVTGGGLCQLSGIIYLLALKAGLQVEERHAHSMDIYTEEERFAPLGSDATVAYGYKDLRLRNNTGQSVCFCFAIEPGRLTGYLRSREPLRVFEPQFLIANHTNRVSVETLLKDPDGFSKSLHTIEYRKLHGPG
jgi:vancomycin resistance protein VanW